MGRRQMLASVLSLALATTVHVGTVHAQTYLLAEGPLPKSCFRIELSMTLNGKISVQQDGKKLELAQKASARHVFHERLLEGQEVANKAARRYQLAEATIEVEKDSLRRSLPAERSLLVVQRRNGFGLAYCPTSLLNQEEMELTEHLDTLYLPGLLPGKELAAGATWKIANHAALALGDLDALVENNLVGKLESVQADTARGTITGKLVGIDLGAQATLEVQAAFIFDLKEKRLVQLTWKQADSRQQGPVTPALTAEVTYVMKRTPILEPNELSDVALVAALAAPVQKMALVHYRDAKGRFEFQHSRDWHLVGQQDDHVVYRLLSERGDFIAQATLTPYRKEKPGAMMKADDFALLMANAPGWEQDDKLLEKNENVNVPNGAKAYRIGAAGKLDGVAVVQYFHLLHGPQGDQMIVTFTMRPEQADQLQLRDMTLIQSITFGVKGP
jgi:hypothetical protein